MSSVSMTVIAAGLAVICFLVLFIIARDWKKFPSDSSALRLAVVIAATLMTMFTIWSVGVILSAVFLS